VSPLLCAGFEILRRRVFAIVGAFVDFGASVSLSAVNAWDTLRRVWRSLVWVPLVASASRAKRTVVAAFRLVAQGFQLLASWLYIFAVAPIGRFIRMSVIVSIGLCRAAAGVVAACCRTAKAVTVDPVAAGFKASMSAARGGLRLVGASIRDLLQMLITSAKEGILAILDMFRAVAKRISG
jgi:hypothetical protein